MTIRVQASTAVPSAPSGAASVDNDTPNDLFAALLGSQLSAVTALPDKAQGGKLDAALADGKGASHEAADGEAGKTAAAVDPATLLAMPVFVPPVIVQQAVQLQAAAPAGTAKAELPAATLPGANLSLPDAVLGAAGKEVTPQVAALNASKAESAQNSQLQSLVTGEAASKKVDKALELFQPALNESTAAGTPANAHPLLAEAVALAQPVGTPPVMVASAPQALPLTIREHLSDSNWSQAMGQQLMTMVNLKSDQAHISLNPSHLGPIEVSLKIEQNQAQVVFNTVTPQAREAVENSLPRLASMLAGNGIQLSDAQVSSGQSGAQRQAFSQQQRGRRQDDGATDEPEALATIKAARGILSTFA
jgi:flagellar hook-length control protein FliK